MPGGSPRAIRPGPPRVSPAFGDFRHGPNLGPPYMPDAAFHGTSAAVEFGVRVLGVHELVVMGHALCGGVRALLEGTPPEAGDFVAGWISIAARARDVALRCDAPEAR